MTSQQSSAALMDCNCGSRLWGCPRQQAPKAAMEAAVMPRPPMQVRSTDGRVGCHRNRHQLGGGCPLKFHLYLVPAWCRCAGRQTAASVSVAVAVINCQPVCASPVLHLRFCAPCRSAGRRLQGWSPQGLPSATTSSLPACGWRRSASPPAPCWPRRPCLA